MCCRQLAKKIFAQRPVNSVQYILACCSVPIPHLVWKPSNYTVLEEYMCIFAIKTLACPSGFRKATVVLRPIRMCQTVCQTVRRAVILLVYGSSIDFKQVSKTHSSHLSSYCWNTFWTEWVLEICSLYELFAKNALVSEWQNKMMGMQFFSDPDKRQFNFYYMAPHWRVIV